MRARAAGGGGKVSENTALRGFPGGDHGSIGDGRRRSRMYGEAYTCRLGFGTAAYGFFLLVVAITVAILL
jgi:hypothetical protein